MKQKFILLALLISICSLGFSQDYQLDSSFGKDGTTSNPKFGAEKVATLPDGRIITVASGDVAKPNLTCTFPNGKLDRSFGNKGRVLLPVDISNPILLIQNNQIVVGGMSNSKTFIVRYNNNGTLDNSFANGRKGQGINAPLMDIKLRTDGKLILIFFAEYYPEQYSTIWQLCLNVNGTVNTSFGNNGTSINTFRDRYYIHSPSFAIDQLNRIFAAGYFSTELFSIELRIIGFNNNGNLDNSFGSSGSLYVSYIYTYPEVVTPTQIQVLANGNILTAGTVFSGNASRVFMFECKPDGTTESAFGTNGIVTINNYNKINKIVEQDEKIYLSTIDNIVFRFLKNGKLDSGFCNNGILTVNIGVNAAQISDMVLLDNADILLTLLSQQQYLAKYAPASSILKEAGFANNLKQENIIVSLYPNPTSNYIHISGLTNEKAAIQVINNSGKIVQSLTSENEPMKTIDVQDLPTGIYFVRIIQHNELKTLKFLKQ